MVFERLRLDEPVQLDELMEQMETVMGSAGNIYRAVRA